jgi:hypothetical protein
MAYNEFSTSNKRVVPVKHSMFYSDRDAAFELHQGIEYIEGDTRQYIVLYRTELSKTNQDMYGETRDNGVNYLPPVELPCSYLIEDSQGLASYDKTKNLGTYQKPSNLKVYIYEHTLKEYDVDIKTGDYIGIQHSEDKMSYYTVVSDGRLNIDNDHGGLMNYKRLYRTIIATYVDPSEFAGE